MAFHRGVAEVEPFGDLGVGQALGDQPDDLDLAGGQLLGCLGGRAVGGGSPAEVLDQAAVMEGASRASPAATVCTAVASWSRLASLSRKPLAPARIAR